MQNGIKATIGVDLGDRKSWFHVVDQVSGDRSEAGSISTTPEAFARLLSGREATRLVVEAGTHSPWVSRIGHDCGLEVLVANPRRLGLIYGNLRKCDRKDAELLARMGRADPHLLAPIRHRGPQAQQDLALVRARAALVGSRTKLVNMVRGQCKSIGGRITTKAAKAVGVKTFAQVPDELQPALGPALAAIDALTDQIRAYDRQVDELATNRYPETEKLSQVPGVGNLTALAFVLTLEDPAHFARSRDVGPFLGLVPRQDQTGLCDRPLPITKAGDRVLRTLLVQSAHYVMGRLGPESDLKNYGLRIAARGGKVSKRKAAIAVARKLATLLHALWRTGEVYQAVRPTAAAEVA